MTACKSVPMRSAEKMQRHAHGLGDKYCMNLLADNHSSEMNNVRRTSTSLLTGHTDMLACVPVFNGCPSAPILLIVSLFTALRASKVATRMD